MPNIVIQILQYIGLAGFGSLVTLLISHYFSIRKDRQQLLFQSRIKSYTQLYTCIENDFDNFDLPAWKFNISNNFDQFLSDALFLADTSLWTCLIDYGYLINMGKRLISEKTYDENKKDHYDAFQNLVFSLSTQIEYLMKGELGINIIEPVKNRLYYEKAIKYFEGKFDFSKSETNKEMSFLEKIVLSTTNKKEDRQLKLYISIKNISLIVGLIFLIFSLIISLSVKVQLDKIFLESIFALLSFVFFIVNIIANNIYKMKTEY